MTLLLVRRVITVMRGEPGKQVYALPRVAILRAARHKPALGLGQYQPAYRPPTAGTATPAVLGEDSYHAG